jgi:predicted small metal-binding protein
MSMQVVECNVCGDTLSAASDEELVGRMRQHYKSAHPSVSLDEAEARETIANEAYTASDS